MAMPGPHSSSFLKGVRSQGSSSQLRHLVEGLTVTCEPKPQLDDGTVSASLGVRMRSKGVSERGFSCGVCAPRWILSVAICTFRVSLIAQLVKNLPVMQETLVQFLGWEDSLEKGYPLQYSGLENSRESRRVGLGWASFTFICTFNSGEQVLIESW